MIQQLRARDCNMADAYCLFAEELSISWWTHIQIFLSNYIAHAHGRWNIGIWAKFRYKLSPNLNRSRSTLECTNFQSDHIKEGPIQWLQSWSRIKVGHVTSAYIFNPIWLVLVNDYNYSLKMEKSIDLENKESLQRENCRSLYHCRSLYLVSFCSKKLQY